MPNGTYGGVRGRETKVIGGKFQESFVFLLLDLCLVLRVSAADSACGGFPAAASVCGQGRLFASESACGQGLRTGAHLRCFPSHRFAAGPSPFTKPRAATPSEVPAHPAFPGRGIMLRPWAAGITPVLTSALHRFASLGLKSGIAAQIAIVLTSWLHRFASLGLKSRIDAQIAPVLTFWLHRFASLSLK